MARRKRYPPYALTDIEQQDPKLRRKITRCIKSVEITQCPKEALMKDGTYNHELCEVNPIAICRSSLAHTINP